MVHVAKVYLLLPPSLLAIENFQSYPSTMYLNMYRGDFGNYPAYFDYGSRTVAVRVPTRGILATPCKRFGATSKQYDRFLGIFLAPVTPV